MSCADTCESGKQGGFAGLRSKSKVQPFANMQACLLLRPVLELGITLQQRKEIPRTTCTL